MGLNENMVSFVRDRKGHDFRYSVNSKKIKSLGFQNKIELKVGLEETIKWYLDNTDITI
jgi:dTDP-glucose 4,6-dehydratase